MELGCGADRRSTSSQSCSTGRGRSSRLPKVPKEEDEAAATGVPIEIPPPAPHVKKRKGKVQFGEQRRTVQEQYDMKTACGKAEGSEQGALVNGSTDGHGASEQSALVKGNTDGQGAREQGALVNGNTDGQGASEQGALVNGNTDGHTASVRLEFRPSLERDTNSKSIHKSSAEYHQSNHIDKDNENFHEKIQVDIDRENWHKFVAEHQELVRRTLLASTESILQHIQCVAQGPSPGLVVPPSGFHDIVKLHQPQPSAQLSAAVIQRDSMNDGVTEPLLSRRSSKESSSKEFPPKADGKLATAEAEPVVIFSKPASGSSPRTSCVLPLKRESTMSKKSCYSNGVVSSDDEVTGLNIQVLHSNSCRKKSILNELPADYLEYLQTTFDRLAGDAKFISLDTCLQMIETYTDVKVDKESIIDVLTRLHSNQLKDDLLDGEEHGERISFEDFAYLMAVGGFDNPETTEEGLALDLVLNKALQSAITAVDDYETCLASKAQAQRVKHQRVALLLDFVPAPIIIMNAFAMAVRADYDPEAEHWKTLDIFFLIFYVCEAAVKLWLFGFTVYWCGPEWSWNWFDISCILVSVVDMGLNYFVPLVTNAEPGQMGGAGMLKMMRLGKLGRLVKALQYPIFKELKAMVCGVVSGVRVIAWAMVLLFFCVFFLGTIMNSVAGDFIPEFSTIPGAMFTVFRCFTDGCSAYDGSPLQETLRDRYGFIFIIAYTLAFMFITIGVFNLIMATFIDSVMKDTEVRRHEELAEKTEETLSSLQQISVRMIIEGNKGRKHCVISEHLQKDIEKRSQKDVEAAFLMLPRSLVISKDFFQQWLKDKEFLRTLHDADIDMSCTTNLTDLFDVLDVDTSGELTIRELINGIMGLRGPITKRDMMAVRMQVRYLSELLSNGTETVDEGRRSIARRSVANDGVQEVVPSKSWEQYLKERSVPQI